MILIFAMATAGVHFGLIYATVTVLQQHLPLGGDFQCWYFDAARGRRADRRQPLRRGHLPHADRVVLPRDVPFVSVVTTTGFATADSNIVRSRSPSSC